MNLIYYIYYFLINNYAKGVILDVLLILRLTINNKVICS